VKTDKCNDKNHIFAGSVELFFLIFSDHFYQHKTKLKKDILLNTRTLLKI